MSSLPKTQDGRSNRGYLLDYESDPLYHKAFTDRRLFKQYFNTEDSRDFDRAVKIYNKAEDWVQATSEGKMPYFTRYDIFDRVDSSSPQAIQEAFKTIQKAFEDQIEILPPWKKEEVRTDPVKRKEFGIEWAKNLNINPTFYPDATETERNNVRLGFPRNNDSVSTNIKVQDAYKKAKREVQKLHPDLYKQLKYNDQIEELVTLKANEYYYAVTNKPLPERLQQGHITSFGNEEDTSSNSNDQNTPKNTEFVSPLAGLTNYEPIWSTKPAEGPSNIQHYLLLDPKKSQSDNLPSQLRNIGGGTSQGQIQSDPTNVSQNTGVDLRGQSSSYPETRFINDEKDPRQETYSNEAILHPQDFPGLNPNGEGSPIDFQRNYVDNTRSPESRGNQGMLRDTGYSATPGSGGFSPGAPGSGNNPATGIYQRGYNNDRFIPIQNDYKPGELNNITGVLGSWEKQGDVIKRWNQNPKSMDPNYQGSDAVARAMENNMLSKHEYEARKKTEAWNSPTGKVMLGLQGLSTIGGLYGSIQANQLARDQYNYSKYLSTKNFNNAAQAYNTALKNRTQNSARMNRQGNDVAEARYQEGKMEKMNG